MVRQNCKNSTFWNHDKEPNGTHLIIHTFYERDQGFYYCTVHFQRDGRTFRFTGRINVTAVCELLPYVPAHPTRSFLSLSVLPAQSNTPKEPSILHLSQDTAFPIRISRSKVPETIHKQSVSTFWTLTWTARLSGSTVHLVCTALFPHLEATWWRMWWTVDGSLLEDCPDRHRFSSTTR